MGDSRKPASAGRGRASTIAWTGPLDERNGAALAKAILCLADTGACADRQYMALKRLAGHATVDRDSFWRAYVLPRLPEASAPMLDAVRHALIGHDRLTGTGAAMPLLEQLMQLCRRICDQRGPDATIVCLLDTIALCLCRRLLQRPYLTPAETASLAELPEIADSIDVLLGRGDPWPAAMLQTSLVILAHAEVEGAAASRRVVRQLPRLGARGGRALVRSAALGTALHAVLAQPFVLGPETACLTVGRIARRLITTGHADVLVEAMDLTRTGEVGGAKAVTPELIGVRNRMMAAILYEMGQLGGKTVRPAKGKASGVAMPSNVVLLATHRRARSS